MDYQRINLDEYILSGAGGTALTYTHKKEKRLAKLFTLGFAANMAAQEFATSQTVYKLGIPTPLPIRLVTDGERYGAEYELIENKRSFARIISEEPDRLEPLSKEFATLARRIHATPADTARVPSMKQRLLTFYEDKEMVPDFLRGRIVDFIQAVPEYPFCLHGDLQIGNIIRSGNRDLWIDVGQFSYGVPEWDLGFTWRVTGITREERSQELFHLSPDQLSRHWQVFSKAYFEADGKELEDKVRTLYPYVAARLPFMIFLAYHKPINEQIARKFVAPLFDGENVW